MKKIDKGYWQIIKQAAKDAAYDSLIDLEEFYEEHKILCHVWAALWGACVGAILFW